MQNDKRTTFLDHTQFQLTRIREAARQAQAYTEEASPSIFAETLSEAAAKVEKAILDGSTSLTIPSHLRISFLGGQIVKAYEAWLTEYRLLLEANHPNNEDNHTKEETK